MADPTARLYLLSDVAGALEPCGCVKDQLGGMDHFGAILRSDRGKPSVATLTAGPLFFLDMALSGERRAQEIKKAETIAKSLASLNLQAVAPGRNDWAAGADVLATLGTQSGATILGANVTGAPPLAKWVVKDLGGFKLGIIGVSAPDKVQGETSSVEKGGEPFQVTSSAPADAVRAGIEALDKEGAQGIIVLASVGRGEAKRIADANPQLLAVVVGSPGRGGDANTTAPPVERIGDVLIVETANHLQTVATLDLYVRDAKKGLVKFADATGIERSRKREALSTRIDELRAKIATWEKDKSIDPKDVEARKADVAKLETERDALDKASPPASGSFFRYAMHEVREKTGRDDTVYGQMLAYYKAVNEANKVAFASKVPAAPARGEAGYVGIDTCTNCHDEARAVWDKTAHAHAYQTLSSQFKEFNLDCVSCHVTGYDKRGGSTVTHTDELKNVQCEECHGPGSSHAKAPKKSPIPRPKPDTQVCLGCHHPPHVHEFDAKAKMAEILGPGHGAPK